MYIIALYELRFNDIRIGAAAPQLSIYSVEQVTRHGSRRH